jgi:uncharacterized repeat protein (TIGR03803 family)
MIARFSRSKVRSLVFLVAALSMVISAAAVPTEQVVYNFSKNGSGASVHLVYHSGRLYGASTLGGDIVCSNGCGSVFELAPKQGGGWNYRLLYAFTGGTDGNTPMGAVVFDAAGNLYGAVNQATVNQRGGVFKLTPSATGQWTETTIYSFGSATNDGQNPNSGVTEDAAGNLYGVTLYGGTDGQGIVYQLTPNLNGTWTESILHNFAGRPDAGSPAGEVSFDQAGNLYGTTVFGGTNALGAVYELSPASGGAWTEKVIYSFDGTQGQTPEGPVTLDATGNVFGLTNAGGKYGEGTAFELIPGAGGSWNFSLVHTFGASGDGGFPSNAYLTAGSVDTFYGTTFIGGAIGGGTVFRLKLEAGGQWSEELVHSFGAANDGSAPYGSVTVGPGNALFGGTSYGGTAGTGVIYEVTP